MQTTQTTPELTSSEPADGTTETWPSRGGLAFMGLCTPLYLFQGIILNKQVLCLSAHLEQTLNSSPGLIKQLGEQAKLQRVREKRQRRSNSYLGLGCVVWWVIWVINKFSVPQKSLFSPHNNSAVPLITFLSSCNLISLQGVDDLNGSDSLWSVVQSNSAAV